MEEFINVTGAENNRHIFQRQIKSEHFVNYKGRLRRQILFHIPLFQDEFRHHITMQQKKFIRSTKLFHLYSATTKMDFVLVNKRTRSPLKLDTNFPNLDILLTFLRETATTMVIWRKIVVRTS